MSKMVMERRGGPGGIMGYVSAGGGSRLTCRVVRW